MENIYIRPHPRHFKWGILTQLLVWEDVGELRLLSLDIIQAFESDPHLWNDQEFMISLQKWFNLQSEENKNIIEEYFIIYEEENEEE